VGYEELLKSNIESLKSICPADPVSKWFFKNKKCLRSCALWYIINIVLRGMAQR
jgi:hypothetical protein